MGLVGTFQKVLSGIIFVAFFASILGPLIHPAVPVLKDGIVVVTGCSPGGLGFQIVKDVLAKQPKTVSVLCTVRKDADAEALKKDFGTDRLRIAKVDVTDTKGIEKLAASLGNEKIIGLVNNAGVGGRSSFEEIDYRYTFDVNVFAVYEVTKYFIPHLRRAGPGSRIVNIGSMAGTFTRPNASVYSASKRALESITDGMRVELGPQGISASIVQPGYFLTKMCNDPKRCGAGIDEVSDAVLHGLFAERPRTRYPVATIGIMSAWAGSKLANIAPDRLVDFLILTLSKDSDL